jgi:predicted nuclease of predicted toxin-antitoxin system
MKIIIDECLPKRVSRFFSGHDVYTVPQIGLGGYKDSELLNALDKRSIDVFITIDGNIEYQQQFTNRVFGTIIIRAVSNRFADLEHFEKELRQTTKTITAGLIVHIPL